MKMTTTRITLWVNRLVGLVLLVLLPTLPAIIDWYGSVRALNEADRPAILIAFYICAAIAAVALWSMDSLLRSILRGEVFTKSNVRRIRIIRWCCGLISLVCLPAAFVYYPLAFMVVIMAFLCLVISVLVKVMVAAVAIREENDLTI